MIQGRESAALCIADTVYREQPIPAIFQSCLIFLPKIEYIIRYLLPKSSLNRANLEIKKRNDNVLN
jgi:hypothetical protein